jgi:hypothetical protein
MPETRSETPLLVVFVDLTRFDATGVTLSVAAFRKLGPALRRRFKKHTAPVTYIRLEDRRVG